MKTIDEKRLALAEQKRDELRHAFRNRDRLPMFPGDVDSLVIQSELRCTLEQASGYRRLFREFSLGWAPPEHPRTRNQFDVAKYKELRAEYPDADRAALYRCVPNHYDEWWAEVEAYGKKFGQYRARFLTGLTAGERRTLVKFYRECIPRGYVLPECR